MIRWRLDIPELYVAELSWWDLCSDAKSYSWWIDLDFAMSSSLLRYSLRYIVSLSLSASLCLRHASWLIANSCLALDSSCLISLYPHFGSRYMPQLGILTYWSLHCIQPASPATRFQHDCRGLPSYWHTFRWSPDISSLRIHPDPQWWMRSSFPQSMTFTSGEHMHFLRYCLLCFTFPHLSGSNLVVQFCLQLKFSGQLPLGHDNNFLLRHPSSPVTSDRMGDAPPLLIAGWFHAWNVLRSWVCTLNISLGGEPMMTPLFGLNLHLRDPITNSTLDDSCLPWILLADSLINISNLWSAAKRTTVVLDSLLDLLWDLDDPGFLATSWHLVGLDLLPAASEKLFTCGLPIVLIMFHDIGVPLTADLWSASTLLALSIAFSPFGFASAGAAKLGVPAAESVVKIPSAGVPSTGLRLHDWCSQPLANATTWLITCQRLSHWYFVLYGTTSISDWQWRVGAWQFNHASSSPLPF